MDADASDRPVPRFHQLDRAGVERIHEASIELLERGGVQLNHERARRLLVDHGGEVHDDGVVTVPGDLVETCLDAAPARFTLHARGSGADVTVGGEGAPVRAPVYGPPNVRTVDGGRRRARLADYERLVKLAQVEEPITCTGYNLCDPADVERGRKHLALFERSLSLTDKPVMGPTHGRERAEDCMEMLGIATGDPDLDAPYVIGLINTVPPRSVARGMLGGLMTYAEHGQPLIVSSFTMAGASGPPSLAASMVQTNAENLVCIALAQLVTPGTPVVYGVPSSNVDPRHGALSIGSPESALFVSLAAQMARYYDVPSRGGGALTDAKTVDHQSGFESMLLQSVAEFAGIDFVLNAAGVLESYSTASPEKFVLDCEALRYLDRFREGVAVDDATLSLDALLEADPAGHFLRDPDDPDRPGTAFYRSELADKRSHREWTADGRRSAVGRASDRVQQRLDAYERPDMDADTRRELDAYLDAAGSGVD